MRVLALVLGLSFALAAPAYAKKPKKKPEGPKPHTDQQIEEYQVFEKFEAGYGSKDMDARLGALRRVGQWRHKRVLKQLKRIWLKEKDPEILAVAAAGLGNQTPFAKEAGKVLVTRLLALKKWATPKAGAKISDEEELELSLQSKALVAGIHALGTLGYRDGFDVLKFAIDHYDDDVAGEAMLVCGRLKEYRALPILYEWFNFYPDGMSWAGGSVKVDTGAAGTKDARSAKAKWKAKFGSRVRKARPAVWEKLVEAVEMITGEKFDKPEQLKAWMKANKLFLKRQGM